MISELIEILRKNFSNINIIKKSKENFMEVASLFKMNCNLGGCSFLID